MKDTSIQTPAQLCNNITQSIHHGSFDLSDIGSLLKHIRLWHTVGLSDEQKTVCETLLSVAPEHYEILHLLGVRAQVLGHVAEAEDYYRRALANNPDFAFTQIALAQLQMARSMFKEGRSLLESRFNAVTEESGADWRGLPISRWQGESLTGKHIYVWAEQGLGDVMMLATLLPRLLSEAPSRVALGMYNKLISVFARSFPDIDVESLDNAPGHALAPTILEVYPKIEQLAAFTAVPFSLEPLRQSYEYSVMYGAFDVALPMADLIVYFLPEYVPVCHPGPVLTADKVRRHQMQSWLTSLGAGKTIGISWHTTNIREQHRNIQLLQLLPLLKLSGYHFISLQHGVEQEEVREFCEQHQVKIHVAPELNIMNDAEGLLALISALDHVVTIDNSNAHIAGVLGVPTTLLLSMDTNYRWVPAVAGSSFWYSKVLIKRQQKAGDWGSLIREITAEMES